MLDEIRRNCDGAAAILTVIMLVSIASGCLYRYSLPALPTLMPAVLLLTCC